MFKMAAKEEGEKGEQATENKTKHMFSFSMFNRLHNLPQANAKLRVEYKNLLQEGEK